MATSAIQLDQFHEVTLPTLDIEDTAWDAAPLTTVDDLNTVAGVDEWLRPVEQLTNAPGYEDQWSYFMFWINDIRYADRKHHSNEITVGDATTTLNARQTRTVVEGAPKLLNSVSTSLPDVVDRKAYVNDTSEDQSCATSLTQTEGVQSQVTITKQSSINVSANVNIGDFSVSASGTVSQDQSTSLSKDTNTTTTVDHTFLIKARKKLTVITTVSTTSQENLYQTTISIRGKNGQPTINVPLMGGSFADVGVWLSLADLPNLQGGLTQTANFKLVTVTKATTISFEEEDIPEKPTQNKTPVVPDAFVK